MTTAIFASELKPGMKVMKAYGSDFQFYIVRRSTPCEGRTLEDIYQVTFENGEIAMVDDELGAPFLLLDDTPPDAVPGSDDGAT